MVPEPVRPERIRSLPASTHFLADLGLARPERIRSMPGLAQRSSVPVLGADRVAAAPLVGLPQASVPGAALVAAAPPVEPPLASAPEVALEAEAPLVVPLLTPVLEVHLRALEEAAAEGVLSLPPCGVQ